MNNNNNLNKRMHKGGEINALISVKSVGGWRGQGMGWGFDCLCRPWGGAFDWSCSPRGGDFESFLVRRGVNWLPTRTKETVIEHMFPASTCMVMQQSLSIKTAEFCLDIFLLCLSWVQPWDIWYVQPGVGEFGCIWLEWFACGQGIWRHIFEKCQIPTPCPA